MQMGHLSSGERDLRGTRSRESTNSWEVPSREVGGWSVSSSRDWARERRKDWFSWEGAEEARVRNWSWTRRKAAERSTGFGMEWGFVMWSGVMVEVRWEVKVDMSIWRRRVGRGGVLMLCSTVGGG